jgi:hypothetical protein
MNNNDLQTLFDAGNYDEIIKYAISNMSEASLVQFRLFCKYQSQYLDSGDRPYVYEHFSDDCRSCIVMIDHEAIAAACAESVSTHVSPPVEESDYSGADEDRLSSIRYTEIAHENAIKSAHRRAADASCASIMSCSDRYSVDGDMDYLENKLQGMEERICGDIVLSTTATKREQARWILQNM